MVESFKEIKVTNEGTLQITTSKNIEINIPPHLPLKLKRFGEKEYREVANFCDQRKRKHSPYTSRSHRKTVSAIKEGATDIYQSYFLIQAEDREKIHAFSEVNLDDAKADCIVVGPVGTILFEAKPTGVVAQEQLDRGRAAFKKYFPKIPILTIRAGYKGNKVFFNR